MKILDLILTGWAEIRAHKMRSFLSFFAIAVGIATFFYTLSILSQRYHEINQAAMLAGDGRIDTTTHNPLDLLQYEELQQMLPPGSTLSLMTDWYSDRMYYKYHTIAGFSTVGVFPSWLEMNSIYRLEGRFISKNDIENRSRVIVLMAFPHEKEERRLWESFWGEEEENPPVKLREFTTRHNLLGQQVSLYDETFTVVGILHVPELQDDPRFPMDRDNKVFAFVPHTTWYDIQPVWREEFMEEIRVRTNNKKTQQLAANTLVRFLRAQFGVNEKPEIKFFDDEVKRLTKEARIDLNEMLFLGFIAMIAGGIGIMNVTMAVIFSRTKEIGIRRALGATRRDILAQFLVEAMLLGLCGSLAGMLLGYGAVLHLAVNTKQMTFSWWVVLASILIALLTSFLFALYPAWQASRLKPVEALKYE